MGLKPSNALAYKSACDPEDYSVIRNIPNSTNLQGHALMRDLNIVGGILSLKDPERWCKYTPLYITVDFALLVPW